MAVNQALILHNWLVGEWILEFQEHGKDRAKYGTRLLETLAADLKAKEIKGFTAAVFRQCLLFCSFYPQIRQTQSVEFPIHPNSDETVPRIPATLSPETAAITRPGTNVPLSPIRQKLSAELPTPLSQQALFKLSWSHFQELIAIDEPRKRAFFENECIQSNWSVRQLRRQIGSLLYERTDLSTNKKAVIEKARKQERQQDFTDLEETERRASDNCGCHKTELADLLELTRSVAA